MLTQKGQATRERIVVAAAALMYEKGVAGTSTEDVRAAAKVSMSQIYHYFSDKRDLTRAVIEHQSNAILGAQEQFLGRLDDLNALRAWGDFVVQMQRQTGCRGGCPLGSLASELSDSDDPVRDDLAISFRRWQHIISAGITAMRDRGELRADTDVDRLATALLTTVQGGILLTKTLRDTEPLETALDIMFDHISSFTTGRGDEKKGRTQSADLESVRNRP